MPTGGAFVLELRAFRHRRTKKKKKNPSRTVWISYNNSSTRVFNRWTGHVFFFFNLFRAKPIRLVVPRDKSLVVMSTRNTWDYFRLVVCRRDEEREKPAEPCAKSITSSDDSTRRRTSSSNDSVLSESAASGYSSPPLADVPWPPNSAGITSADRNSVSSSHHRAVADAPTHEVLETTVWVELLYI